VKAWAAPGRVGGPTTLSCPVCRRGARNRQRTPLRRDSRRTLRGLQRLLSRTAWEGGCTPRQQRRQPPTNKLPPRLPLCTAANSICARDFFSAVITLETHLVLLCS